MAKIVTRLRGPARATAPSSPDTGEIFFDTAQNKMYVWNGSSWQDVGAGGSSPPWAGNVHVSMGNGEPEFEIIQSAFSSQTGPSFAGPTPTNISTTVARCVAYRCPYAITVNKVRFYGIGNTTNLYRFGIYRDSDGAQIMPGTQFTTATNTWGSISPTQFTLAANTLYWTCVSAGNTGTTAGLSSPHALRFTTLPSSLPGNLAISAGDTQFQYAQFTVSGGTQPGTLPTLAAPAYSANTGSVPLFFLDNNNA